MADKKIEDLTAIVSQSITDLYETSLDGTGSRKETRSQQNTYWNNNIQLPSTSKVTGLDAKLDAITPVNVRAVYVSKAGNNTTGTGTESNPFLTYVKARDFIVTTALVSASDRYVIKLDAGAWTETEFKTHPYISVEGSGIETTIITITSGFLEFGSEWEGITDGFCEIKNIRFPDGMVFDTSSFTTIAASLRFDNVECVQSANFQGTNTKTLFVQQLNCFLASDFGSVIRPNGCYFQSIGGNQTQGYEVAEDSGPCIVDISNDVSIGSFSAVSNSETILCNLFNSGRPTSIIVEGSDATINCDQSTYITPIIVSGGIVNRVSTGFYTKANISVSNYTPVNESIDGHLEGIDNALGSNGTLSRSGCVASSTANLTATYNNGTSGVGATLTNSSTKAALSLDGAGLSVDQRVLIRFQTNAFENGIYTVTVVGDVSTNWVLTRSTDFNNASTIVAGTYSYVQAGQLYGGKVFGIYPTNPITVGSDDIIFGIPDSNLAEISADGYLLQQWPDSSAGILQSAIPGQFTHTAASVNFKRNSVNIMDRATLITGTLPSTSGITNPCRIKVRYKGVGGWRIAQNSGDQIIFGNTQTTVGTGGYIESTAQGDCVDIELISPQLWIVTCVIGNITVV